MNLMEGQRNIVETSISLATSPNYSRGEYRTLVETEGTCLYFAPDSPGPSLSEQILIPIILFGIFPPFLTTK